MPTGVHEKFTAKELIKILKGVDLAFEHENLRDWHRRELIPVEPVGRGRDRYYTFDELVDIAALAFLSPHMRYGGLHEAKPLARRLSAAIKQVYATGPDGDYVDRYPTYVMVYQLGGPDFEPVDDALRFRAVASIYNFRGAVAVCPGYMALGLSDRIQETLKERNAN